MADTTNRLAGIAYLTVDGTNYMLAGDFAYSVSKVARETLMGQDRVHGYSEKPKQGSMSGTIRDAGGLSVASFNAMTNVTVTVELANGKTIIGRNMWTVGDLEVKTTEATFEVKWEGFSVEEA
ncbi:phage tail tube protein [Janthinobacterium sp. HH103]|uniref:phage tail tube protein n=1 Tax=Janthinobacterium TaxID=29580 RepID=UPI000874B953|nr:MULTISPECIES: phage tail tube protein [Janthinobacterium]MCA1860930.1 phage tail tube protein [Janthinobacterium lividum]OEZ73171.1 phage tail tube protein [Janthinobacterium sp. HH100]OEZ73224.1 phage tail tube protein [Janthinobacterium sp. HH100]OEZ88890.1 phage tail tube protein [Janthinobacterium sp. HH103]QOU75433.1 Phage tail tube protein [Janthinobacterium sp. HH102]